MAMCVDRCFSTACVCFLQVFFCVVLTSQFTNKLQNTSIDNLHIPDIHTGVLQPDYLERTFYHHVQRRSLLNTDEKSMDVTTSVTTLFSDVLSTKPSNINNTIVDHHEYYNSTIFLNSEQAMSYWAKFDTLPQDKVVLHRMLSDSYRKAATVTLSFDFPFYGYPLRNITIVTGGFVYMGDYIHNWLAATQYIAPLMANFDTSLSEASTVRYFDNGTAFVIEWHEVMLQDGEKGRKFTFQTTLLNNGNIIFVYKTIPVPVTEIGEEAHPVKVGLSDGYVIDKTVYFIRRKTIHEYSRIDMKEKVGNQTAIYFNALTTCLSYHSCNACMSADVGFDCIWCEAAERCSDGVDRLRDNWLKSECDVQKNSVICNDVTSPNVSPSEQPLTDSPSETYTLFPRTSDSSISSDTSTLPYLPDKTSSDNVDNGSSTSARALEKLLNDLKGMMVSGEHSDTIIKVKGEEFRLHRNILSARCPYFNSMLNSDMIENNTRIISIDDCKPNVFRSFIYYLYTGKMDMLSPENVCDLYKISDKYQEDLLKDECIRFMINSISVENFINFMIIALIHDEKELLTKATSFFASNTKEIVGDAKWLTFLKEYPVYANELYIKALNMHQGTS